MKYKTSKHKNKIIIASYIFIFVVIMILIAIFKDKYEWIETITPYLAPGATIFVLLFTTLETRRVQEENRIETRMIQEENRIKSKEPILDLSLPKKIKLEYSKQDSTELTISVLVEKYNNLTSSIEWQNINLIKNFLKIINLSHNASRNVDVKLYIDKGLMTGNLKKAGCTISEESYMSDFIFYSYDELEKNFNEFLEPKFFLHILESQDLAIDLEDDIIGIYNPLKIIIENYILNYPKTFPISKIPMPLLKIYAELSYYDTDTTYYKKVYCISFVCEYMDDKFNSFEILVSTKTDLLSFEIVENHINKKKGSN